MTRFFEKFPPFFFNVLHTILLFGQLCLPSSFLATSHKCSIGGNTISFLPPYTQFSTSLPYTNQITGRLISIFLCAPIPLHAAFSDFTQVDLSFHFFLLAIIKLNKQERERAGISTSQWITNNQNTTKNRSLF